MRMQGARPRDSLLNLVPGYLGTAVPWYPDTVGKQEKRIKVKVDEEDSNDSRSHDGSMAPNMLDINVTQSDFLRCLLIVNTHNSGVSMPMCLQNS